MRLPLAVLVGISLLWGSEWILSPLPAQVAAPFAASALTLAFGALLLLGASVLMPRAGPGTSLRINLLLAVTLFAAPIALLIEAGRHGASGWIPLLYTMLPLFLAFAEDAWTPAMALAPGAALVLLNGTVPFTPGKLPWAAAALAAVALQAWALRSISCRLRGRAILPALGLQTAAAAALLGLGSLLADPAPRLAPPGQWSALPFISLLLLAALGTALPYAGLVWLLTRTPFRPPQVAVTQWLQLLFAVGGSALLTRARVPWAVLAAAGALLGCCWGVLRRSAADQVTAPRIFSSGPR